MTAPTVPSQSAPVPGFDIPGSPEEVAVGLRSHGYLPDEGLATVIFLALSLRRPLLLEGEAGVGKTEVAKVLSRWTGGELIRLQCYEGIDASQALYEWDYTRQLLHLRTAEAAGTAAGKADELENELYSERFLVRRPVLAAISDSSAARSAAAVPPVLLVDEIDRADDEFEAFLLEVLSDYSVTIPELGTFTAAVPPIVIITSNRTRDVHDALKRRCLYHWVEHPDLEREIKIIDLKTTACGAELTRQVATAVEAMRDMGLYKPPGVAESIDWAESLARLGVETLDEASVRATLGAVLKYREDQARVSSAVGDLLAMIAGS